MGKTATLATAHPASGLCFVTLPRLPPAVPSPQRSEDQGRGAAASKTHVSHVCQACGWCRGATGETNTPARVVEETYSKSSAI